MRIISPKEFRDVLDDVVISREKNLLERWSSASQFTEIMRSTIVPKLGEYLHLIAYSHKDYYLIDAILYEELDNLHFGEHETYAKAISVAIEIENDPAGTAIEMNRLQIYNVPLKVLITYPRGAWTEQRLLDMYSRIIAGADTFDDFSTERKQLVAFATKYGQRITWSYHTYNEGRFVSIK